MSYILLFSSDASELYQGDIFRVLALPSRYAIQFRYEKPYVLPRFWADPHTLKDRKAVICFLAGNDLNKPEPERSLVPYPIRLCKIREVVMESSTNQLILILTLGDYSHCKLSLTPNAADMPPAAFVTERELPDLQSTTWIERVKDVEKHFPDVLFYNITSILKRDNKISPSYNTDRRISFFMLKEESDYSIECSCFDPKGGGKSPLRIRVSSEDIDLDNSFESGPRARLDTRRLPLTTRTLKTRSAPASFIFYSGKGSTDSNHVDDANQVRISWLLKRKYSKPWLFGLFTFLAALGLALVQLPIKPEPGQWVPACALGLKILGIILVGIAGGLLFNSFNKV